MKVSLLTGFYPPPYNANSVRAMYMVKTLKQQGFFKIFKKILDEKIVFQLIL